MSSLETARNDAERAWARYNIDRRFWSIRFTDLRFKKAPFGKRESLSPVAQRGLVKALIKDARRQLVCFGSAPTDEGALRGGYYILQTLYLNGWRIANIDPQEVKIGFDRLPQVIVFQNILAHATDDRTQRLRDLLHRFRSTLRIVCVAGASDPYGFCTKRLGLIPHGVCHFRDPA